jgi:hypothetical protein
MVSETSGTGEPSGIDVVIVRATTFGAVGKMTVRLDPDFEITSVNEAEEILVDCEPSPPPLKVNRIGPVLMTENVATPFAFVVTGFTPRFEPSTVSHATDDPITGSPSGDWNVTETFDFVTLRPEVNDRSVTISISLPVTAHDDSAAAFLA